MTTSWIVNNGAVSEATGSGLGHAVDTDFIGFARKSGIPGYKWWVFIAGPGYVSLVPEAKTSGDCLVHLAMCQSALDAVIESIKDDPSYAGLKADVTLKTRSGVGPKSGKAKK